MRIVVYFVVLLVGSSFAATDSCGLPQCTCVETPQVTPGYVRGQLERSTAVFLGTVTHVTFDTTRGAFAEIRVSRRWKGAGDSTVKLYLRQRRDVGTTCDLWLREGEEWLIFATTNDNGALASSFCSASVPRGRADSSITILGISRAP